MKLQVPLRIAKSVFLARIFLYFHEQNDVLFGNPDRCKLVNITFDKLTRLQHLKQVGRGGLNFASGQHHMFLLIGMT